LTAWIPDTRRKRPFDAPRRPLLVDSRAARLLTPTATRVEPISCAAPSAVRLDWRPARLRWRPFLRKNSKLGKYRLDRRLGQGSFADVWKARDVIEGVTVALKIAHPAAVRSGVAPRSSRRRGSRPGCATPTSWRCATRTGWTATSRSRPTSRSRTLAEYRRARRSAKAALRVIREVAQGLGHAHGQRVLHRDVKPENIMIFADGHAALGDFGARASPRP
jgi:serine/threonine-protein kinase